MKPIYHYATVSEALKQLNKKGFIHDFNLQDETIQENPHRYEIEHVYRYEGNSDPDEEAVVYGITSKSGERGVYVAGFSANSESEAATVLAQLCIQGNSKRFRT
ncbi:hypothetical protein FNW25_02080 [Flavobacterium franklandianum]|uniref:hypothetical protein n=1 Tax=Flavobacterium franklandianum TaxID=2594430 RepID=UPI001179BE28|nr:hypothetical protein [Flavobacterium franklandianum]TRX29769.1 hypothetical protein FNW25_02080 [Flavobacterium franklandianum]